MPGYGSDGSYESRIKGYNLPGRSQDWINLPSNLNRSENANNEKGALADPTKVHSRA